MLSEVASTKSFMRISCFFFTMAFQINVLAASLLMAILLGSTCRSGSIRNNSTKFSGRTPSTNNPPANTIANNRTNSSVQSSTPTKKSIETKAWTPTSASVSMPQSDPKVGTSSHQSHVMTPDFTSWPSPRESKANTEVLSLSLGLVVGVLTVGIVIAVLLVRWKRIKKMKKGFQEELATICLHDELASEALYASWKPFMDTNETSNMKLVIQQSTQDAKSSTARLG